MDSWNLDDDFPLGDGTADTSAEVDCPWCGARVTLSLDPGGGSVQRYVEDCAVCCRPWDVELRFHTDGSASVALTPLE